MALKILSIYLTYYRTERNLFSDIAFCKAFFFYLGSLSQTFTIHRTAEKGRGYFVNSSLPPRPTSQTLKTLIGQILQRTDIGTYLAARLKPEALGFRAQVTQEKLSIFGLKFCLKC